MHGTLCGMGAEAALAAIAAADGGSGGRRRAQPCRGGACRSGGASHDSKKRVTEVASTGFVLHHDVGTVQDDSSGFYRVGAARRQSTS